MGEYLMCLNMCHMSPSKLRYYHHHHRRRRYHHHHRPRFRRYHHHFNNDNDYGKETFTPYFCFITAFKDVIRVQGGEMLVQKVILETTETPTEVDIAKLVKALENITPQLGLIRNSVLQLKTAVQFNIDECRGRRLKHTDEIETERDHVDILKVDIFEAKEAIRVCQADSKVLEDAAGELEKAATSMNETAEKRRKFGKFGLISGTIGVALAPFTGK